MSYNVAFLPWVTKTAKTVKKKLLTVRKKCVCFLVFFYIIIEIKSSVKIIGYTYHHLPIFYAENKIKLFRISSLSLQLSILYTYFKHPLMVQCICNDKNLRTLNK